MRWLLVLVVFAGGCASAGSTERSNDGPDASVRTDGSTTPVDASADAGCVVTTSNLLTNGNFDMGATGWMVTPIDSGDPVIATAGTGELAAQSPTYRAWLGGYEAAPASNKDVVFQDVMVPATTTALAFAGYYEVRSAEPGTTAYDKAVVELASTADAQIELIKNLDNLGKTTAWTQVTKAITANLAGQTVRVKLSSAGDGLYATSFYFDTLELNATYCQ